ncbi:MAG TPA: serine/threonine protein kinase [Micromonosporaceae bacterium]|nr:serine/threonine protein kinase [Micromonosporaceae bacterium]
MRVVPSDPTELGPYRLLRRIGEGGMGSVYLAQQGEDGNLVALKVIRQDLSTDPDFRRRFRSEVARAQQVPAFCTAEVLDADPDHEPPYLVVEFVNGPSLARVVQNQGPLSPANLHGLAIGVATALTAIHGAGVIHRDLKPANVLLAPGSPKVIDFGIARAAGATATDTSPNMLMGTIPYMAPERLDPAGAKPLTPAADIFAWGAVVAFAGTGRTPFTGASVEAVAKILTQPPDLTGLTGDLRELVERALSKDPKDRPTARELLDHLVGPRPNAERLIEAGSEQAVVSVPAATDTTRLSHAPAPTAKPKRRKRLAVSLTLSIVVITAITVAFLTGMISPPFGLANPTSPSTTPVLSVSQTPSMTPSATASPSLWGIDDNLAAPGVWFVNKDHTDTLQSKCVVSGGMKATTANAWPYRCHSNLDPLNDFKTEADIQLLTQDSCAGIWFRWDGRRGFLVSLCEDRYQLYLHDETLKPKPELVSVRTIPLPEKVKLKQTFRAGIIVRGNVITFLHNGVELPMGQVTNDSYPRGKVILGLGQPVNLVPLRPSYEVMFRNFVIRELPSSQP